MTETRELSVTRYIDAPPAKVWDAMVNRQSEWFCPAPWRAEVDHQDRRAGGRCETTFYGPDGEVVPQKGIYLAFDEGRRFVTTDAAVIGEDRDFEPAGPMMIGFWEIAPEGSGTRYTARPSLDRRSPPTARGNGLRSRLGCVRRPAQGALRGLMRRQKSLPYFFRF